MTEDDADSMVREPTDGGGEPLQTYVCPVCDTRFHEALGFCPDDGTALVTAQSLRPRSLVGETIADRYEIEEQIAVGGMGIVYKARQKMVGRDVAIKILPRELAADSDTERRFFNEARAISQLRHPNIVTLFDFGRTKKRDLFIVMEYVKGEPLSAHLESGPMALESVVQIGEQICSALEEAHRVGIVHRDIKPDNVMLEIRGGRLHVRLLDFGIAKSDIDTARKTQTGIVFGTPEYISPEQVLGRMVDARADLYGVGLILFEMLSGERPFEGSGTAVAYRHAHDPVPVVLEKYPDQGIPAQLSELIRTIMAKDPLDRPSSASAVRRRLQEATMLPVYEPEQSTRPMPLHLESSIPPPIRSANVPPRTGRSSIPPPVAPAPITSRDSLGTLPRPWEESDPRGRTYDPAVHESVRHSTRNRTTQNEAAPRPEPQPRRTLLLVLLLLCVIVLALVYTVEETTYRRYRGSGQVSMPSPTLAVVPAKPAPITRRAYDGIFGVLVQNPLPDDLVLSPEERLLASPEMLWRPTPKTLPTSKKGLQDAVRRARAEPVPKDAADKAVLFAQRAVLEWAAANAQHADELIRYEQDATAFLNSNDDVPPTRPIPIYGNAVAALEWLVAHKPAIKAHDVAQYYLARGLSSVGRADAALARLRSLIALHPQSPYALRARWPLSQAALSRRDWPTARRQLEALSPIQVPAMHRAVRYSLAHVAYAQDRYEEGIDHLQQVIESLSDGPSRSVYWAPAMEALTLSYARIEGGGRLARSYFRGLGGMGLVLRQSRLLGFALGVLGRGLEAIAVYEWHRSSAPEDSGRRYARSMQAQNQVGLGNQAAAEPLFLRSRGCTDGLPPSAQRPCQYALGKARADEGKWSDARVAWTALESIPGTGDDVEALHWQSAARFALAVSLDNSPVPDAEPTPVKVRIDAYTRVGALGLARWSVPAYARVAELLTREAAAGRMPKSEAEERIKVAQKAANDAAVDVGLRARWRTPRAVPKTP